MAGSGLGLRGILSHMEAGGSWSRGAQPGGQGSVPKAYHCGYPGLGMVRRRGSRRSWGPHCKCRSTYTSLGPRAQERAHSRCQREGKRSWWVDGWAALSQGGEQRVALPCEEPEGIWGSLLQAGGRR